MDNMYFTDSINGATGDGLLATGYRRGATDEGQQGAER